MIKDAIIISVVAALINYIIKSYGEIYTNFFMYGIDKGLSVPQIETMFILPLVFVSVILSKYIIYYTFK